MRVTTKMAVGTLINNLDRSYERIAKFQQALSSGSRLNNLSDDPAAVERSLGLRGELRQIEQFQKNNRDGKGWLELTEATLGEMETMFVEVRGLAVQGATSTYNASQRNALADQVNQFLEHTLSLSEARYRGRYVFAGTQTEDTPYLANRDTHGNIQSVTARGNTTGTIEREVSDGMLMQINVSGDGLFDGPDKAFNTLIRLRDSLRANDQEAVRLLQADLSSMRETVSETRGTVGARVSRLEVTNNLLDRVTVEMTSVLSEDEDVDLAATIVNLRQEEDVFQAALASGNMVIQQSLMDFIG
jgi:flagellar hook-associated protein 3 FlgL